MGEFTAMNITTIKAKSQLAAKRIEHEVGDGITGCNLASIIEDVFVNTHVGAKPPIFAMAAFSGVVGIPVYRIADPSKIICFVPCQLPFESRLGGLNTTYALKRETERIACLIVQALNAS